MPLRCFIKARAAIDPDQLEIDLADIIAKRFCGLLTIQRHTSNNEVCDWTIAFDTTHAFPICLRTNDQIELERPDDAWSRWAQLIVEDILAVKYEAKIIDEEYPGQEIVPELEKHDTFVKHLDATMVFHSPAWKEALINIEMAHLPFELRAL